MTFPSDTHSMLRPVTAADLGAMHALQRRAEVHDRLPFVTPPSEFEEWLADPDLKLEADTRVAVVDGGLAAWGRVWYRPSGEREERCHLMGTVDPAFRGRGIGRTLLAWQVARARERLAAAPEGLPRWVRAQAYDFQSDVQRLYQRAGMRAVRWSFEMLRDLAEPVSEVAVPGVAIEPWERARDEQARQVMNAAFADHWGSTPRGVEGWRHELESYSSRLDLSYQATDGGVLVGATRNSHFPGDEALTGRRDGWIMQIGVLRSHRRRGIAGALISRSLSRFRAEGFTHAALGVDAENPTGALGLYEALGFRVRHRAVTFQLPA
jgi:ribosomal protein S18 acetylase RimI-like enzyme